MQIKNTTSQYGAVAKSLHWVIFLLVLVLLVMGTIMHELELSPLKIRLYGLHKSFGVTVFVIMAFRLLWKLQHTPPVVSYKAGKARKLSWLQEISADAAHWLLYLLLLVMPLSGLLMSSAAGFPVSVFGLFTVPDLIAPNKEWLEILKEVHAVLANIIMLLVGMHAVAALIHHFYYKDNVLRSMLPFAKVKDDSDN